LLPAEVHWPLDACVKTQEAWLIHMTDIGRSKVLEAAAFRPAVHIHALLQYRSTAKCLEKLKTLGVPHWVGLLGLFYLKFGYAVHTIHLLEVETWQSGLSCGHAVSMLSLYR
jgi:hypothetical protein